MVDRLFQTGDIVKIKSDIDKIFDNCIGVITSLEDANNNIPGYFVLICGMPHETFWFLEYELELLNTKHA